MVSMILGILAAVFIAMFIAATISKRKVHKDWVQILDTNPMERTE